MRGTRGIGLLFLAMVIIVGFSRAQKPIQADADTDHDGLSDAQEQALLDKFVPKFQVSTTDCAVKPAEFAEGVRKPTARRRDGTIYGQVTPHESAKGGDAMIEVHFYDLWSVDCGRMGHPLDAEHVSVLLQAKKIDSPLEDWKALYWFAAAHEDTVCDASQIAAAKALDAEEQGATIWISAGKHGAFLSEAICPQGCGGDRCVKMAPLQVARVINIGESDAAMHGALWVHSPEWPLVAKMRSDFSATTIAGLDHGEGTPVERNEAHDSVKGTIYVANSVANGLGTSGSNTGAALNTADEKTEGALDKSAKSTGDALKKSTRAVGHFLHLSGDEDTKDSSPK
jgi:hypothetical protein